jgi:P27 family predicted phage terminase small subunit
LKLIAGNPGHRPLNTDEPEPDGDLFDPPASFSRSKPERAARLCQIWREAIGNAPAGLLRNLDGSVLERYCRSWLTYLEADEKVEEAGAVIKIKGGQFQKNPFLSIRDQQNSILDRLCDQMGFSPAARTRVKVSGKKKAKSALGKLRELQI